MEWEVGAHAYLSASLLDACSQLDRLFISQLQWGVGLHRGIRKGGWRLSCMC